MISFLNFDGSSVGTLPAGFSNTTTIPGHTGNYKVRTSGSISSPNSLYDAGGLSDGSALWTGLLAADEAIQFDQVVSLTGGVIHPLIRMSSNGQSGYAAFVNWSTPKIDFVVVNAGVISTLASPSIPSYANGAQVTIKLEVQGTNLRFKSWLAGTAEPTSWTATTTDSTYSAAGYPGFCNGGGSVDNVYFGPAGSTFSGGFIAPSLSSGTTTWNSLQLSWTAATQSGGTIAYQLLRSPHGANAFAAVAGATSSPATDATVATSTVYDYMVRASDGVNAPVNSNVLTLATPSPPAATSFTLSGPAYGYSGSASTAFTVAPSGSFTGTITITPSGAGLSTPIVLTFNASVVPQTFTITPTALGTVTLTATNSAGLLNPGASSYISTAAIPFVAGSGQSIPILASGTITSVQGGNDTQTLAIRGFTSGGSFELAFNGQTTTAIAVSGGSPTCCGIFTIPVTPGTAYLVATNLVLSKTVALNPDTLVQIFDGPILVWSGVINQATGTPDYTFVDHGSAHPGNTISMKNLTTITPASSNLSIYFSTTVNNYSDYTMADLVILTDVATGVATYYDNAENSGFSSPGFYNGVTADGCYDGYAAGAQNPTLGGVTFEVSASAVESALAALSSVGAGNVLVVGSNPFTISFVGSLAGLPQPTLTCNDPAVSINHSALGGVYPTITITPNGGSAGSPIPLTQTIWCSGANISGTATNIAPYGDYAICPLPQSAPDHLYYPFAQGLFVLSGDWPFSTSSRGKSGRASYNIETGSYLEFDMQGLPPATYQVALTWVSDTGTSYATNVPVTIVDAVSGATLVSTTINQSTPCGSGTGDFALDGHEWRVVGSFTTTTPSIGFNLKITNPGGTIAFDTVVVSRTSANHSVQVPPGATVLFTSPAGFITTTAGPCPAFSAVIPNLSGGTSFQAGGFGAFAANPKTMAVGMNSVSDFYYGNLVYSDLIGRVPYPVVNALASDSLGYPTLLSAQSSLFNPIVLGSSDQFGLGRGLAAAPNGLWTFQWTGPDLIGLGGNSSPATEVMAYQNLTGPVKQRVFNIQETTNLGPQLSLGLTSAASPDGNGHYAFSSNNIHIYPPNPSDPTGMTPWGILGTATPPRFHPNHIAQYGNCQVIRLLAFSASKDNFAGEITDFRQPGSLYGPTRSPSYTVTSITNYTGTALIDPQSYGSVVEVTVSQPIAMTNGMWMDLTTTGTMTFSDGSTLPAGTYGNVIALKSPTVIHIAMPATTGSTMTNTLSSGTLSAYVGTQQSLADCVELCNACNADAWFNCHTCASPAYMTAVAQYFAANLNPGLKIYAEFGNENWNYAFATWQWCRNLTYRQTYTPGSANAGGPEPGNVLQGKLWHDAVIAAFTAAGRASDVVRVIGTQAGNSGLTSTILSICQAQSVNFEVLAPAAYFDPWDTHGIETTFQNAFDLMTPYGTPSTISDTTGGQSMDWYELMVAKGGYPAFDVASHQALLAPAGFTNVQIALYEAGADVMTPSNSLVNTPFRSHVLSRHPRNYWATLAILQGNQDVGCVLYMKFSIVAYLVGGTFPFLSLYEWGAYESWNQVNGTGNPVLDTINVNNPEQVDQIVSEVGGGLTYWNSLVPSTNTRKRITRINAGQMAAIGARPHGTSGSARAGRHK